MSKILTNKSEMLESFIAFIEVQHCPVSCLSYPHQFHSCSSYRGENVDIYYGIELGLEIEFELQRSSSYGSLSYLNCIWNKKYLRPGTR